MMLPANQQAAIVAHPAKAALNLKALLVNLAASNDGSATMGRPRFLRQFLGRRRGGMQTLIPRFLKRPRKAPLS